MNGRRPFSTGPVLTQEELLRCAVMLAREFTEPRRGDGRETGVGRKEPRAGRPAPKTGRHLGTGFLVADRNDVFLVTAAHVARRMERDVRILFACSKGTATSLALSRLVRSRDLPWVHHRTADVAVLPIHHPTKLLRSRSLPIELLPARKVVPDGSLDLLVVGFPLGHFAKDAFAPVTRRLHAASPIVTMWGDEMRRPSQFFLLDHAVMGGSSGAPVFVAPQLELTNDGQFSKVKPFCAGFASQTISDESAGQFTCVVPSATVRKTIATARGKTRKTARPTTRF